MVSAHEIFNATVPNPYSDEFKQGLIAYVRHFNQVVHTVDGPGILRNFYYAQPINEINGLEIEMPVRDQPGKAHLVIYNFPQVTLPTLDGRYMATPVFIHKSLQDA